MKRFNRELFKSYQPKLISEGKLREYAIFIPLVFREDQIYIVFQRRSANISQPGDICFPGGKIEENEAAQQAAVRETQEELLLKQQQIDVLGPGDSLINNNSVLIHSYVGVLYDYHGTYNEEEVDLIVELPLTTLLASEPKSYEVQVNVKMPDDFPYEKIEDGRDYRFHPDKRSILFYEIGEVVIWGLTAKLLKSFLERIEESTSFE